MVIREYSMLSFVIKQFIFFYQDHVNYMILIDENKLFDDTLKMRITVIRIFNS